MTIADSPAAQLPQTHAALLAMVRQIGAAAAPHAARHDREASFVTEGYEAIRAARYGAIAVPQELGGGGHDLEAVCSAQATLARFCANTSLAIAMHQHTVLSLAWRWRLGDDEVEPTLRRIASEGLLLSSSGTADLSNPSVTATPTEGGLLVSGQKRFCSGVPGVDVIATMARVDDGTERWNANVLIPASAPGTEIVPDWDAMGMRGSGSNPVIFTDVFVPEDNIMYLRPIRSLGGGQAPADQDGDAAPPPARPGNGGRPAVANGQSGAPDSLRMPGLQIALTVIAAVYLGAAEGVRDQALRMTARQGADDPAKQRLAGLLTHEYRSATWALDTIIMDTDDDSLGTEDHFITTMLAKRQVILSSIKVVELSMELLGSRTYMRSLPFEQALRDVRAGITHPLAPDKTLFEVGKSVLQRFARQQAR